MVGVSKCLLRANLLKPKGYKGESDLEYNMLHNNQSFAFVQKKNAVSSPQNLLFFCFRLYSKLIPNILMMIK